MHVTRLRCKVSSRSWHCALSIQYSWSIIQWCLIIRCCLRLARCFPRFARSRYCIETGLESVHTVYPKPSGHRKCRQMHLIKERVATVHAEVYGMQPAGLSRASLDATITASPVSGAMTAAPTLRCRSVPPNSTTKHNQTTFSALHNCVSTG